MNGDQELNEIGQLFEIRCQSQKYSKVLLSSRVHLPNNFNKDLCMIPTSIHNNEQSSTE